MRPWALALVPLLAAGCIGPGGGSEEWYLGGSFTTDRTQEDVDAVCAAGRGSGPCELMESYPEQFGFRFASKGACETARGTIALVPHTNVRDCARVTRSADPDAATSSNATGGAPA